MKLTGQRRLRILGNCLGGIIIAVAINFSAAGQTPTDPAAQEELDRLFEQVLRDPADLDLSFKYAETAVRAGNFEAAISALERMLLFNPNLPRVRLELGILYFRLGSYDVARDYLTRAIEGPDVPDAVRERVSTYLAEIDRRASPSRFSGSVFFGGRYQSDASAGPNGNRVRALGNDAVLNSEFARKSDVNPFIAGTVQHIYDLQNQSGDVIESNLTGYYADQRRVNRLDLGLLELNSGPRFAVNMLGPGAANVRPYVLGNVVYLSDARYFDTIGTGVSLGKQWSNKLSTDVSFEVRDKNYRTDSNRPFARDLNGQEYDLNISGRYATSDRTELQLGTILTYEDTRARFQTRRAEGLYFGYNILYRGPFEIATSQPWMISPTVARVWTQYDDPDPSVDPNVTRHDREWRLGLLNVMPVTDDWSAIGQIQRFVIDSNLPNFAYKNWAFTLGLSRRF
ncbi:MAG: tetratricopeptide repeat protein [Proteobacteria bacterium]|nr:tetratricopeptide repeat protein [Pseudomonadota bacterium]